MGDALGAARTVHDQLAALVAASERRRLDGPELTRFDALQHDERLAAKRYLAARHWREAVVSRLRELRLRADGATAPPAT